MVDEPSRNKSQAILLLFLSLFLFVALLLILPHLKNNQLQNNMVKMEAPDNLENVPVKEELPAGPVVVEEALVVGPEVLETQNTDVSIEQEDEPEQPVEVVTEKQIIERKIWQSNKGRLISNKEYVYFGKYIIVKEEIPEEGSKNN